MYNVLRFMPVLHSLSYRGLLPETFNNPFDYVPHPVCEAAVADLLPRVEELMRGNPEGKMFGVLVVSKEEKLYYLAAFSGQLYDQSVLPGFVPPVFDFLAPDGYFKIHEAEISAINQEIDNNQTRCRTFPKDADRRGRDRFREREPIPEGGAAAGETAMDRTAGKGKRSRFRL